MYVLADGTLTCKNEIEAAWKDGKAVLNYGWKLGGGISVSLMLDGIERDTRDNCYNAWEEVWTKKPASLHEALQAAYFAW